MRRIPLLAALLLVQPLGAQIPAQLSNQHLTANFGQTGLTGLTSTGPGATTHALHDAWSLTLDNDHLGSKDATPTTRATSDQITYTYQIRGYQIDVLYRLRPEWNFVTKQIVAEPLNLAGPGWSATPATGEGPYGVAPESPAD